jgi:hypothetical protein
MGLTLAPAMRFTSNEGARVRRLITAPLYVVGFALYFLRPLGIGSRR